MGTLALTITGSIIGGAATGGSPAGIYIGGAIGGAIGSQLDSRYIYPTLFPPKPIEQGRLKELDLGSSNEGGFINRCFGKAVRTDGSNIWLSPTITKERSSGGKGNVDAQEILKFQYYSSVAIACGRGLMSFKKILADGKILYDLTPDINYSSNQISAKLTHIERPTGGAHSGNQATFPDYFLEITAPISPTLDFRKLRSGKDVTISGFLNSNNNRTLPVDRIIDNHDGTATFRVYDKQNKLGMASEAAGPIITIFQDLPEFNKSKVKGFTFYTGSMTQNPDPLIESYQGAGNVSAYRGICYVVIEELLLETFGNRLPQFTFILDADPIINPSPVSSAISQIMIDSGYQASDFDVTGVTGNLGGYSITDIQNGIQRLEPLLVAFDIVTQETNGKIYFKTRGTQDNIPITNTDLAAHLSNDNVSRPVGIDEVPDKDIPAEVNIAYRDPELYWQKSEKGDRVKIAISEGIRNFDFDITMTGAEARSLAGRILLNARRTRQSISAQLPPHYIHIEEGDYLTIPAFGQNFKIMVRQVTRGANRIMEIDGSIEDITTFTGPADIIITTTPTIGLPPTIRLEVMDIAPLRDNELDFPGYYFVAANADANEKWAGAAIYSGPNDDDLDFKDDLTIPGIIGETTIVSLQTEVIVDNEDSGAIRNGNWKLVFTGDDPYGGSSRTLVPGSGAFTWNFTVPTAGTYKTFIRFTAGSGRSSQALYTINHDSGSTTIRLAQSDEYLFDRWVHLGDFSFTGAKSIVLTGQPDGNVNADAIRLLKIDSSNLLGNGPVGYWDRKNSVTVRLNSLTDTLESRTDFEVLSGKNFCMIGSEVIGFRTATLVSEQTYILSNLLRGLRNTEIACSSHTAGERFVLLDPNTLNFRVINVADMGTKKKFKAVAPGEIVDNFESQEYLLRGNSIRPFSPRCLRAKYFGVSSTGRGFGTRISYFYGSRAQVRALSVTEWSGPGVEFEGFRIEVRNNIGILKRTIDTIQSSYDYDSTDQAADGLISTDIIEFRVFQKSSKYGVSLPSTITSQASVF